MTIVLLYALCACYSLHQIEEKMYALFFSHIGCIDSLCLPLFEVSYVQCEVLLKQS